MPKGKKTGTPTIAPTTQDGADDFIVMIDLAKVDLSQLDLSDDDSEKSEKTALRGSRPGGKGKTKHGKLLFNPRAGDKRRGRKLQAEQNRALVVLSSKQLEALEKEFGEDVVVALTKDSVVEIEPNPVITAPAEQFAQPPAEFVPPEVTWTTSTASEATTQSQSPGVPWHLDQLSAFPGSGVPRINPTAGAGGLVVTIDSGIGLLDIFNDPNGNSRLLPGKSYIPYEPDPYTDIFQHGTNMASLSYGTGYSLAPGAQGMSYKVFDSNGAGLASYVIHALADVVQLAKERRNAGIRPPLTVSMSLRFKYDPFLEQQYELLFQELKDLDVVVVVAAGNDYAPACDYLPAKLSRKFDNVITVASIRSDLGLSSFSNYEDDLDDGCITAVAPGEAIQSATLLASGTSQATAIVAGVAIAARAENPNLTYKEIINHVKIGIMSNPTFWPTLNVLRDLYAVNQPRIGTPLGDLKDLIMDLSATVVGGAVPLNPPLRSTPQLRFAPLESSGQRAGLTFNVNGIDANVPPDIRLALLSQELPQGFAYYKSVWERAKDPAFNGRQLPLHIKQNGDYWIEYYKENGKNMLAFGQGKDIGKNLLKTYSLDSLPDADKIVGSDLLSRFAFQNIKEGSRARVRNFVGSGNMAVPVKDTIVPRTTFSPTISTASPTMGTPATEYKLQKVSLNKSVYLSLPKGNNAIRIAIDGEPYDVRLFSTPKKSEIVIYNVNTGTAVKSIEIAPKLGMKDKRIILKVANGEDKINVSILNSQAAIAAHQPKMLQLFFMEKRKAAITVGYPKTRSQVTASKPVATSNKKLPTGYTSGRRLESEVELPTSQLDATVTNAAMLFSGAVAATANVATDAMQAITDKLKEAADDNTNWTAVQMAAAASLLTLGAAGAYVAYTKYTSGTEDTSDAVAKTIDPEEALLSKPVSEDDTKKFEDELVKAMLDEDVTKISPKR